MNLKEYQKIQSYSYNHLCEFLLSKNGSVQESYFKNKFTKNRSISKKGFEVHHILEDRVPNLSNPLYAIQFPSSFQEPKNLLYCDMLEHYLLHILIVEEIKNAKLVSDEIKITLKENSKNYYRLKGELLKRSRGSTLLKKHLSLQQLRGYLVGKDLILPGINGINYIERRISLSKDKIDRDLFILLEKRAKRAKTTLSEEIIEKIKSGFISTEACYSVLKALAIK